MKLLVTGGAGFIGSHLVEKLLKENNEVVAIDNFNDIYDPIQKRKNVTNAKANKNYKLYEIDLRKQGEIEAVFKKEKEFDFVFHLAGVGGVRPSQENPVFYYEENVLTTINLVEAMKKYNCKNLIYYSSSSVYGNSNKEVFSENDTVDTPISIYAATKKASEVLLYTYYLNYNFKIVIIRPFSVFGPRQRSDLAIYLFVDSILNNKELTIFGDGSMIRDYTYVTDVIDATIKSISYMNKKENVYEIFNVANSNPKTIMEVIKAIEEITSKVAKIRYKKQPIGDVNKTFGDNTKAEELLGWEPKTGFKEKR